MQPLELIKKHQRHQRENIKETLLNFSLADVILEHRQFDAAMTAIANVHHSRKTQGYSTGLLICGPSGVGKSTIIRQYSQHFPAYDEGNRTVMPVLVVTCPSSATASGLMSAMFTAMHYPVPSRSDLADKTLKVIKLIKLLGVQLLLLDEFQHAYYTATLPAFRQLIDTVKVVITETNIASVLVGLHEAHEVIATNEQVARRHSEKLEITPFKLEDDEDFKEFRSILKSYQAAMPLPVEVPLYEANLARRFLIASHGNLDYLRRLLEKSIHIAAFADVHHLDVHIYAAAFREYVWKSVPDKLNPFHNESPLRSLDKTGEPYYPWSLRHAIGSPLARRNIIDKTAGEQ